MSLSPDTASLCQSTPAYVSLRHPILFQLPFYIFESVFINRPIA